MAVKTGFSKMLGPVRLVLPGIIVSLIGGSAGFLLFNNPGKIKGKSTWDAWNAVLQYEKIYDNNVITTTRFYNSETIPGLKKYKNDIMHQIQMLSENFKNIKEEGNVDNRLFAIINCKVDTYNQIHRMTDIYLDSLIKLGEHPDAYIPLKNETDSSFIKKLTEMSTGIMDDYNRQRQHLIDRDSSTINNILQQLTNSYRGMFYQFKFTPRLPDEFSTTLNSLYGSWEFLIIGGGLTLQKDNTGELTLQDDYSRKGKWSLDKHYRVKFKYENKDTSFTFKVINISDKTIRLTLKDSIHIIGYRSRKANQ